LRTLENTKPDRIKLNTFDAEPFSEKKKKKTRHNLLPDKNGLSHLALSATKDPSIYRS
jgi:hypothetical protein